MFATLKAPMSIERRAKTAFTDCSRAESSGRTAELADSALFTVHSSFGSMAPGMSG